MTKVVVVNFQSTYHPGSYIFSVSEASFDTLPIAMIITISYINTLAETVSLK